MDAGLEQDILRTGRALAAGFPDARHHPIRAADERAMQLASQDADLRAALFRFVDVVPACRSLDDLAEHLGGFLEGVDAPPPPLRAAMRMSHTRTGRAALGAAAAAGVRHMAHRFIAGADAEAALPALRGLWRDGIAASVDLLGEATVTAAEADRYAARCAAALDTLAGAYERLPGGRVLERDAQGAVPRANLSVKVSALTPLLRPEAPERGQADAAPRLRGLLLHAARRGAHLHVDMESLDSREAVTALVGDLLAEPALADGPSAGIVLQAYLRDAPAALEQVLDQVQRAGRAQPLTVRLVKGAYWDHEVTEARSHGWSAPVFEDKAASDRTFEALTARLLDARAGGVPVRAAIASHNLRSVAHAAALADRTGADVEFQVLRGLGDDLAAALVADGRSVRMYCPVGDLVAGMAYLVRRLLENTSNESFLHDRAEGVPLDRLLAAP
jgi:proline dehydrogenase